MAEHVPWKLFVSSSDPTRVAAVDPESPESPYTIASCWTSAAAPTREIAVANARRIVAAWQAVRGIATEDIGLIDSLIREARILASNCLACGKTGRMGDGRCYICNPMRVILAKLDGGQGDG